MSIIFNPQRIQLAKAQPTAQDVHVNAPLMNVSLLYSQEIAGNFVADQIFPLVPVTKQSDIITIFPKAKFLSDEAQVRAPGTEAYISGYDVDFTNTYFCIPYALKKISVDRVTDNADFNMDEVDTKYVTEKLLLKKEIEVFNKVGTAGSWNKSLTGVASGESAGTSFRKWSDYAASNPYVDIAYAKEYIQLKSGFEPNTLVLSYDTYQKLRFHPLVRDQIKFTSSDTVVATQLAAFFDVEKVIVQKTIVNTAKEGAVANNVRLMGAAALLMYVAKAPSLYTPSAGYTFGWDASQGQGFNIVIRNLRNEFKRANEIEGESAFDSKILDKDLGIFFTSAV